MAQNTEVLSMRISERTRFQLEFISRIRGQSYTEVVKRAIEEQALKGIATGEIPGADPSDD